MAEAKFQAVCVRSTISYLRGAAQTTGAIQTACGAASEACVHGTSTQTSGVAHLKQHDDQSIMVLVITWANIEPDLGHHKIWHYYVTVT